MNSFLRREEEIRKSVGEILQSGKVVILTSESSIPNQIYRELGDKAGVMRLGDGSTGFYLKKEQGE